MRRPVGSEYGSSPLARGTLVRRLDVVPHRRFIPARAGNTPGVFPCGAGSGSSPLARGTPGAHRCSRDQGRFIPARAGNTRRGSSLAAPGPVHPRSRGEHSTIRPPIRYGSGSSPLARGTPDRVERERRRPRFIPARAGNTARPSSAAPRSSVHPRSRGEHLRESVRDRHQYGSSPLARGTLGRPERWQHRRRFIPARAGNTSGPRSAAGPRSVHPRSRGEHRRILAGPRVPSGSSPLARGTPSPSVWTALPERFIPARAGNTRGRCARSRIVPVHPRSRGEHASQNLLINRVFSMTKNAPTVLLTIPRTVRQSASPCAVKLLSAQSRETA